MSNDDIKPSGLGEFLRTEREKRHITIEQIASATKINIKLLHALETENFDALPAKPFVRGFVTSYVRQLGLDPRETLARFEPYLEEKSGHKFSRPADAPHIFVEKEGTTDNSKTILTVFLVGFLVAAAVAYFIVKPTLKHRKHGKGKQTVSNDEIVTVVPPPTDGSPILATPSPAPSTVAPMPAPMPTAAPAPAVTPAPKPTPTPTPKPSPTPKPTPTPKPKPTPTPKPTPKPKPTPTPTPSAAAAASPGKIPPIPSNEVKVRLVVRATEDAWVKYQVDDRPIQQYTLKTEKTIWVRGRESLRFTTAKPKAIEVSYDAGASFKPFGKDAKTIILPKNAEGQYKDKPFIDPNPTYLSTP